MCKSLAQDQDPESTTHKFWSTQSRKSRIAITRLKSENMNNHDAFLRTPDQRSCSSDKHDKAIIYDTPSAPHVQRHVETNTFPYLSFGQLKLPTLETDDSCKSNTINLRPRFQSSLFCNSHWKNSKQSYAFSWFEPWLIGDWRERVLGYLNITVIYMYQSDMVIKIKAKLRFTVLLFIIYKIGKYI